MLSITTGGNATRSAITIAAAAGLMAVGPLSASASTPSWGTGARTHSASSTVQTVVTSVRIGHHSGYDRLVLTFRGPVPGYDVRYVASIQRDPSGRTMTLLGGAKMRVVLRPTSTSTPAPQATQTPRYPEIRQLKGAGDFEGVTSYGVGLASKQAFRVFTLTSPNRLVVDVRLPR